MYRLFWKGPAQENIGKQCGFDDVEEITFTTSFFRGTSVTLHLKDGERIKLARDYPRRQIRTLATRLGMYFERPVTQT
jgi:hypothetical protein